MNRVPPAPRRWYDPFVWPVLPLLCVLTVAWAALEYAWWRLNARRLPTGPILRDKSGKFYVHGYVPRRYLDGQPPGKRKR